MTVMPSIEELAHTLALEHEATRKQDKKPGLLIAADKIETYLTRVHRFFINAESQDAQQQKCAEWFLDNYYIIQKAARQLILDMPPAFYKSLPILKGTEHKGWPRIYILAWKLLSLEKANLEIEWVGAFIRSYEKTRSLTTGEIWALPAMLRLAVLQKLVITLRDVTRLNPVHKHLVEPTPFPLPQEPVSAISQTIRNFMVISATRWKDFFQKVSTVHHILGQDPLGAYSHMDFETSDRYRREVEKIARKIDIREDQVASQAVAFAQEAYDKGDHQSKAHVGYYLIGSGQPQLEEHFKYRASPAQRITRTLTRHPTPIFFAGIVLSTLATLYGLYLYLQTQTPDKGLVILFAILVLIPASSFAISIFQWVLTHLIPPGVLPKMDFEDVIPDDCKTLVAIPTLFANSSDVQFLLKQIELHYLSNSDPNLTFAILADLTDAAQKETPKDQALLDEAIQGVEALNSLHSRNGVGPFHLLVRERAWNEAEGVWMAWERKRGKLEELNRLLRSDENTSYTVHIGNKASLKNIRFVITLDTDTELPRKAANKLIGILAHPLNKAVFNPKDGSVMSGYTLLQPRVEITPEVGNQSLFTRLFSGDTGIDLYSCAVSNVYQDLFGSGIFVGKGIYEIDSFRTSLEGMIPENTLLSHDLLEGIHGRAGLVTDLILFEDYPANYLGYARRMHRWIRGDWQLLRWLAGRLNPDGSRTRFAWVDHWKIIDNLRRSLQTFFLVILLLSGWLWLPGSALVWTCLFLILSAGPSVTTSFSPLTAMSLGRFREAKAGFAGLGRNLCRWLMFIAFLPHEARVIGDAIIRTLFRMAFTGKKMLEWKTAAHTAQALKNAAPRLQNYVEMAACPLLGLATAVAAYFINPSALLPALPFSLLWLLAPEISSRISLPTQTPKEELDEEDRNLLWRLARRTWLFYETFVGPDDQWLPPDNVQMKPERRIAHRTSPTNIGLYMVSAVSAHDFGYITTTDLIFRLRSTFETLGKMERFRGHLLNWYDTRTLDPLNPRFVSTVDNGNLAGCMIVIKEACAELPSQPIFKEDQWLALIDVLDLLEVTIKSCFTDGRAQSRNHHVQRLKEVRDIIREAASEPERMSHVIKDILETRINALPGELVSGLQDDSGQLDVNQLYEIQNWLEVLRQQLLRAQQRFERLQGWLPLRTPPESLSANEMSQSFTQILPSDIHLQDLPQACEQAQAALDRLKPGLKTEEEHKWAKSLATALKVSHHSANGLLNEIRAVGDMAENELEKMDFSMLYDAARNQFYIGYNVTASKNDEHYYDLLASEARLASFIAIARGQAPIKHWRHLGRPLARIAGKHALLSWSGTMFEYLMPALFMHSPANTLLTTSMRAAVNRQIEYGRKKKTPWGISESGFHLRDADENYQYRAFGTPGLGIKRGLGDDLVIAPYASVLALSLRPKSVIQNIRDLRSIGAMANYGLNEAVDYTPNRLSPGRKYAIVASFMAHHQGMSLLALGNFLHDDVMVRRFHRDPRIKTTAYLLHERPPSAPSPTDLPEQGDVKTAAKPSLIASTPWFSDGRKPTPQAHVLSNGKLTSLVTDSGAGGLSWNKLILTPWTPDVTTDNEGLWIYIRDDDSGALWSATSNPIGEAGETETTFWPHKVEHHRRAFDISAHTEIWIAGNDDAEIRKITLTNETGRLRRLTLGSYGKIAIDDARNYRRHPAFSKLFVRSDYSDESLFFQRRPRNAGDQYPILAHRLARGAYVTAAGYESSREKFIGRGRTERNPLAMSMGQGLSEETGCVLDPIMALGATVELQPGESAEMAFITAVAPTRREVVAILERCSAMPALEASMEQTNRFNLTELLNLKLEPAMLPVVQQLLSVLLYPNTARPFSNERAVRHCLWRHGISGDYPILLLRLYDLTDMTLPKLLVSAHHYWRKRGLMLDLVFVLEMATGYMDEGWAQLHRILQDKEVEAWMGRPGGIFQIHADQAPLNEKNSILAAARLVLDVRKGSIEEQIRNQTHAAHALPDFMTTNDQAIQLGAPLDWEKDLLFDTGIGGFTRDGREYVIRMGQNQRPPAPWCNVIAFAGFGCLTTDSGLSATWSENSGENRLTTWSNDPITDPPGEALYLRDEETGVIWSPTPLPCPTPLPYQTRHGAGYTVYEHQSYQLRQEMRVFVAVNDPVKIVRLRLENKSDKPRRITATYYAEWVLGSARCDNQAYIIPEFISETGALLASNPWSLDFGERVAFLTSERAPHGITTDRTEFLGPLGNFQNPDALRRWGLSDRVARGSDPCGVIQVHIELGPMDHCDTHFALGQAANQEEALRLASIYRDPKVVVKAQDEVDAWWDRFLTKIAVKTPEPSMDLMLNRWLLYQTAACRVFGRTGFYQPSGAIGFRDQLQDVMALVHSAPNLVRSHILDAARHQFEQGDVLHWWHPPRGRGVRTRCSDDLLWLPFVVSHYINCTGDATILEEQVPFLSANELTSDEEERYDEYPATESTFSIMEHCRRAIARGITSGPHGLPLMGAYDWNDGMSEVANKGQGESIWLGWFAITVLKRFANLCDLTGESEEGRTWLARAGEIKNNLEEWAWDGHWYLRAFYDDGQPLGSHTCDECQIDSIAQSWSVLSGAADQKRASEAIESARKHLVRPQEKLIRLLWPPFDKSPKNPGYIKSYPPGIRENGAQYTHAATWLAWAFAEQGMGDVAESLFKILNPALKITNQEELRRYRCEPYVLTGDIYSTEPYAGMGGWSWYTGSSGWCWRLGVEGLLGIKVKGDFLMLDPCIPASWPGFNATVRMGEAIIEIIVENPRGVQHGLASVTLDGTICEDNRIPLANSTGTHSVVAIMGEKVIISN